MSTHRILPPCVLGSDVCVGVCVCVVRCGVLWCSVCCGWEEAVPRRPWSLGSGDLPACGGGVAGPPSP